MRNYLVCIDNSSSIKINLQREQYDIGYHLNYSIINLQLRKEML